MNSILTLVKNSAMKVEILFFANCADIVGRRSVERTIAAGTTVGDLVEQLSTEFPAMRKVAEVASFSVNAEYTALDRPLGDGDEVAVIPPVSGG